MSPSPDQFSDKQTETHLSCEDSIADVVRAHYEDVYRFAFRLAGNAVDAEDLTQHTFLTACRKLHQIQNLQKTRAWLLTITRNHFLKGKQRDSVDLLTFEDAIPSLDAPGEIRLEFDTEALQLALNELPEPYKTPIVLYYFEEIGYKQIAEQLQIPIGTVMSRLSRGKRFLRNRLSANVESSISDSFDEHEIDN